MALTPPPEFQRGYTWYSSWYYCKKMFWWFTFWTQDIIYGYTVYMWQATATVRIHQLWQRNLNCQDFCQLEVWSNMVWSLFDLIWYPEFDLCISYLNFGCPTHEIWCSQDFAWGSSVAPNSMALTVGTCARPACHCPSSWGEKKKNFKLMKFSSTRPWKTLKQQPVHKSSIHINSYIDPPWNSL